MLQDIRDRATGPIAWFIIALLVVPFALWGINSYFQGGGGGNDVAKVGGQTISNMQLQQAYSNRYRRLKELLGKNFNPDMIKPKALRKEVLQSLIQRSLLVQYANQQGYRVTNQQVLGYLEQIPAFQDNGKFSPQTYRQVLKQHGMQPATFEGEIRESLLIQQLQQGLESSAVVTPAEVDHAYRLKHESRSVSFLVFHADDYQGKVKVTEQQIRKYYQSHKQAFATPQKVKLAYIDLNRNDLKPKKPATQSALKVLYQAQKDQFTTPAQRKVRHILIEVNKETSSKAAKAKAEMIRKKIEQGASFASMAKKYSQDAGTNDQGGELGWIKRGSGLPKPFVNAAFNLKQGAVSQPVRTQYGWHLIKLQSIRPAHTQSFDNPQVQAKLKAEYQHRAVKSRFEKMSNTLDQVSFENPDSLKPVANKLGLQIKETGWITRNGPHKGIMSNADVRKAAFSDQVFNQHVNSEPIDLSSNREVVLRVAEEQAAQTKPLKQVRSQIVKALTQKQSADMAQADAQKALSAASGGKSLSAVASQYSQATYRNPGFVQRNQQDLDSALLAKAFDMPHPQKGKPAHATVALSDGDYAVVSLSGIRYGDPSQASDSDRKKLRQQLRQQQGQAEFGAYMQSIRDQIKVKMLNQQDQADSDT